MKVATAEAQAAGAQEALQKCRRCDIYHTSHQPINQLTIYLWICSPSELEESRRRELKFRDKVKDLTGDGPDMTERGSGRWKERAEAAEREVAVLRAQNLALRRGDGTGSVGPEGPENETHMPMGEGDAQKEREMSNIRAQLHAKWDSEKKLQKRYVRLFN